MAAKSTETPRVTRDYARRTIAIGQLIHEDGSWSGRERNVFYLNLGEGRFMDVSGAVGLDFPEDGRAFSLLDLDNDGDLDLILKSRNAPQLRILRNDTPTNNPSIAFRLRGPEINPSASLRTSRDAVGALIELETAQGKRVKQVQLGSGFLSQSSLRVYFGLGVSTGPLRATIAWPSGGRQTLTDLPADHLITVVEGEAEWLATPFRPRNFDLSTCRPQQPVKPSVRPEGYAFLEPVPTPPFALKDLGGTTVAAASLRGRPVLLNFWATWCVPCQEEMRQWKEHHAEIRAAGADIIAVSVDEPDDQAEVERFVRERQLPFPVLLIDAETLHRYDIFYRSLFRRSTGLQIPTTFLLDAEGKLVKLYRGLTPLGTLQADLRAVRDAPETLAQAALPYPGWRFAGSFVRDYNALGARFAFHRLFADAVPYLKKAVERNLEDADAWNLLGLIYGREGELERARQALERSIELRPDLLSAYSSLGKLYLRLRQPEKAEAVLARGAQRAPENPAALRQYGEVLIANGKVQQAKQLFRAYLQLEPGDAAAHNVLGILYARTGALFLAQERFAKAVELKPDYAQAYKNLGNAYLQAQMTTQAVGPLARAVELNPVDADAYYLLAYAYAETGRLAEARQALEKVLELRPNDPRARNDLEQLRRSPDASPP
ncbi:MAG: tetratricopeptide repeat protein [Terriglobia bacterium]